MSRLSEYTCALTYYAFHWLVLDLGKYQESRNGQGRPTEADNC